MLRSFASSSAIVLVVGTVPAFAQVTPDQIWERFASTYTNMGYEVTVGAEDNAGSTLTLTDVVLKSSDEGFDASITFPEITLQETGDEKVRMTIAEETTAHITGEVPDAEPFEMTMLMTAPGNETVVSGTPEDMLFEFSDQDITMTLELSGLEPTGDGAPVSLALSGMSGEYRMKQAEGMEYIYDMQVAKADMAIDGIFTDTEDDAKVNLSGQVQVNDSIFTGTYFMPEDMPEDPARLDLALDAGLRGNGDFQAGAMTGSGDFETTESDGSTNSGTFALNSEESSLGYSLSEEGISYNTSSRGSEVTITPQNMPFAVSYAIENSAAELAVPVSQSEDTQPFKLMFEMSGLTLADDVWNLFDPQQQLPRDPANLKIDLSGDAVLSKNLFDPSLAEEVDEGIDEEMTESASPPMPFLPKSLKIDEILLQAVGADAKASGDLTFSENVEQPVGVITGEFTGVNALLEKLVAMGLVPQDQLMGARMMLGMIAKPVEGETDKLQSEIEFKEGGSIFANGQQLK